MYAKVLGHVEHKAILNLCPDWGPMSLACYHQRRGTRCGSGDSVPVALSVRKRIRGTAWDCRNVPWNEFFKACRPSTIMIREILAQAVRHFTKLRLALRR